MEQETHRSLFLWEKLLYNDYVISMVLHCLGFSCSLFHCIYVCTFDEALISSILYRLILMGKPSPENTSWALYGSSGPREVRGTDFHAVISVEVGIGEDYRHFQ
jgi:hypothetical protein